MTFEFEFCPNFPLKLFFLVYSTKNLESVFWFKKKKKKKEKNQLERNYFKFIS